MECDPDQRRGNVVALHRCALCGRSPSAGLGPRVAHCCEALARREFREQITTDGLSVSDIAARISSRLDARPSGVSRRSTSLV